MSAKKQAAKRNPGQFRSGRSGNPAGRPPKVRRDAADVERRDAWVNPHSGHGTTRDRRTQTSYSVDIVDDLEAQRLRRTEFLAAAIIEQGPELALRHPWHLRCEDKELDVAICKQAEALELDRALYDAWTQANTSGGAAIFPVLSGALGDLDQPLDEDAIASVDAFHVFEPQELQPAAYYNDVRHPKFRRPSAYRLTPLNSGRGGYIRTQVIHETRLVIFPGLRVSMQTLPGQREGWGDSILCRPKQVISDFGLAWGSAATLLHNHGKETLEMDGFAQMMGQADGLTEFDNHIAAMQMAWSTLRMGVIDAKSRVSRATGTLGGVAETLGEFKVLMAAAARRPVSILMGQSQSGLRTGDEDTQTWHSIVEGDRSVVLKPRHEQILRLMLLARGGPAGGVEPEAWGVEYAKLSTPSEKEIAETRKLHMETAKIAIEVGVLSADDVAESFYKGDTYSPEIVVDWARREAQAEIDAEGAEDLDDEIDEDELDAMAEEDETEDEEFPDEDEDRSDAYEIRRDAKGRSAGGVRKTGSGKGYNPYRSSDGKFGAGAHKKEPKKERTKAKVANTKPKRAAFDASGHKTKIAGHKTTEAKHRTESLRLKSEMAAVREQARATKPRSAERAKLREQHTALSAQRKSEQAKATEARHARIAESKAMQAARSAHTQKAKEGRDATKTKTKEATPQSERDRVLAPAPNPGDVSRIVSTDTNRSVFAGKGLQRGVTDPTGQLHHTQFSSEAQSAMRAHTDKVLAAYGLHHRDAGLVRAANIEVRTDLGMGGGGNLGLYWKHNGNIALSKETAAQLHEHAQLDAAGLRDLGRRAKQGDHEALKTIDAYSTMTHESIHGRGPTMIRTKPYDMVEELTTEMTARKIVADVHGMKVHEVGGSYDNFISPTVTRIAQLSRRTPEEAYAALADISIVAKRSAGQNVSPTDMQRWVGTAALTKLGVVDKKAHDDLYDHMMRAADSED